MVCLVQIWNVGWTGNAELMDLIGHCGHNIDFISFFGEIVTYQLERI